MPKLSGIPHQRAIRALRKAGFQIARQRKHITMTDGSRVVTVPRSDPVNAYTMGEIVRRSGLTIAEFKKLV